MVDIIFTLIIYCGAMLAIILCFYWTAKSDVSSAMIKAELHHKIVDEKVFIMNLIFDIDDYRDGLINADDALERISLKLQNRRLHAYVDSTERINHGH